MRRLLVLVVVGGVAGCGEPAPTVPKPPPDPHIRVKDNLGGGVGPENGARAREYEGPASQDPKWVKVQQRK